MNVIFLDIDGVLNNKNHMIKSNKHHGYEFDPKCVSNLIEILTMTKAKIILISSWKRARSVADLKVSVFRHYDLSKYIVGKTPNLIGASRGEEILLFLDNNYIDNYVILDDNEENIEPLVDRLILVDSRFGINDDVKISAIKILSDKTK